MLPAALPLIVGGGMTLAGLLGHKKGDNGAQKYLQMVYDEFGKLRPPTPEEMKVQLEDLVQQGVVAPEEAQYIAQNPSSFLDIQENPVVQKAQLQALAKLQGITEGGGLDAQGKARLADVINEFETSAKGANDAIMENAAQRGIAGSGLEMANRMVGTQAAAGRSSRNALDAAAEAEKRVLESIAQTGQLSGDIRSQDYKKAADRAAAVDAIDRFNTANRQDVLNTNVANRNRAQELTLAEKQRLADANAAQRNQNSLRNADLKQADFENKYKITAGKAGIGQSMADAATKTKAADDAFYGNLIGTGGTILGQTKFGGGAPAAAAGAPKTATTATLGRVPVADDDYWKKYGVA